MGAKGWEFAQAYAVTTGSANVYHWLLKGDPDVVIMDFKTKFGEMQKERANRK